ncbi:MAG: cysteine peptidase family C39 domain-containing protein, partial [Deltaproteobacteria bacterium]
MDKNTPEIKKSTFSPWLKTVALIVVAVFLPEQVSWAFGYDPTVLWNPQQYLGAGQEGYVSNFVAENVKHSLEYLANKPLQQVKIAENLVVETEPAKNAPKQIKIDSKTDKATAEKLAREASKKASLVISSRQVKQVYDWLRRPETQVSNYCGVYALNNFLKYNQKETVMDQLTLQVIMVDLLSGNLKEFKGQLRTSMSAIQKVAGAYGFQTTALKINANDLTNDALNDITPFIAHLNGEHFILVTKITPDRVYFLEKDKEDYLTSEDIPAKLSGNILVQSELLPLDKVASSPVSDDQLRQIFGGDSDTLKFRMDYYRKNGVAINSPGYLAPQRNLNRVTLGIPNLYSKLVDGRDLNNYGAAQLQGWNRVTAAGPELINVALLGLTVASFIPTAGQGSEVTASMLVMNMAKSAAFMAATSLAIENTKSYLQYGRLLSPQEDLMVGIEGAEMGALYFGAFQGAGKLSKFVRQSATAAAVGETLSNLGREGSRFYGITSRV